MQRLDIAILVGAILCGLVAAWLGAVVLLVLPARSPGSAPAWTLVAAVLMALALLSGRRSFAGARTPASDLLAGALAVMAVLGGAWLALAPLAGRGEFEGYVVLVSAVGLGQGLLVLASLFAGQRRVQG